jgi:hypothetical protein
MWTVIFKPTSVRVLTYKAGCKAMPFLSVGGGEEENSANLEKSNNNFNKLSGKQI